MRALTAALASTLAAFLVAAVPLPARANENPVFTQDPGGVGVSLETAGGTERRAGGARCTYEFAGDDPVLKGLFGHRDDPRAVYEITCGGEPALGFVPAPSPAAAEALAWRAYRYLPLPAPAVRTNPRRPRSSSSTYPPGCGWTGRPGDRAA